MHSVASDICWPYHESTKILVNTAYYKYKKNAYDILYIAYIVMASFWSDINQTFHTEFQSTASNLEKDPQEMASETRWEHSFQKHA
jgi:hypothetical protein